MKTLATVILTLALAGCSTSSYKSAQWEQDDDAQCRGKPGYDQCRERMMRYREAYLGNSITTRQR